MILPFLTTNESDEIWKIIKNIFTHPIFQNLAIITAVALAIVNAYTASKLAPLAATQVALTAQVSADEIRIANLEKYQTLIIQIQQQLTDMQAQQNTQGTKLESIDSFLRGYK